MKVIKNANLRIIILFPKFKNRGRKHQKLTCKSSKFLMVNVFKWLSIRRQSWCLCKDLEKNHKKKCSDCQKQARFEGDIIIWNSWRCLLKVGFGDDRHVQRYDHFKERSRPLARCNTLHTTFIPIELL
jgi:hypothetical protein